MTTTNSTLLKDRLHAAKLLAAKVASFKDSNAIVVGVGLGGASLGISLAKELNLALQVIFFQSIRHPAHPDKTIGSVSDGIVVLDEDINDIPLDYVMGQVASLRVMMEQDYKQIYGSNTRPSFRYKTIIVVADGLTKSNSLIAGLRAIKSQSPLNVIVAIPVLEPEMATRIASEAKDVVFVHMARAVRQQEIYENYPPVELMDIKHSMTSLNGGYYVSANAMS